MRWLALVMLWTGCTGTFTPVLPDDDIPEDSGGVDSAADSGSTDSGPGDSGAGDSGMTDSGAAIAVDSFEHDGSTATVFCEDLSAEARTYRLVSDHPLRDNLPASGEVTIVERPGQMRLRSGRPLLDALFALAMQEVRDASVSQITDGSFGAPVDCPCFETGEKWTWVWTRDTGYAVEHALAMVDPQRSRDSLLFKLSDQKPSLGGGRPTIVQDTGSGGSWPVSTDRAVWALGAWETLKFLEGSEREAFRDVAYEALVNTLDEDRQWVYASSDGLYRGEQSFLDWREQSYPSWTAQDTVHLAMSRSLSTNLAHWRMMQITRELALEVGDSAVASRMGTWADALAEAIDEQLWLPEDNQYSAMKTTGLDLAPARKFDLLGSSMAALWLVDGPRAEAMVQSYPHAPAGPPVLFPQQPLTAIYHNRGVWPFVTAYDLRAAKRAGNQQVFDDDLFSLVRGAALNLSNMENFEFLTGANYVDDGPLSGPVLNSRRQLWSVAGFIAAFTRGVFGIEATQDGIELRPFVTSGLREDWLPDSTELALLDVPWRGARVDLRVALPNSSGAEGSWQISGATRNGQPLGPGAFVPADGDQLAFTLGTVVPSAGGIRRVVEGDFTTLYAPREPAITGVSSDGSRLTLAVDTLGEPGVTLDIFRDGQRVATGVSGGSWTDPSSSPEISHCYAVASVYASGNASHHSPPACWWGASFERIQTLGAGDFTALGGTLVFNWGRQHYEGWGAADHTLEVSFTAGFTGAHLLQAVYGNGAGPVNTGVTAAHKRVEVLDDSGALVGEGSWVMPHLGTWDAWEDSNFVRAELQAGTAYRLRISDAPNMSRLQRHESYTGSGGGAEAYNFVNIAEIKVLSLGG